MDLEYGRYRRYMSYKKIKIADARRPVHLRDSYEGYVSLSSVDFTFEFYNLTEKTEILYTSNEEKKSKLSTQISEKERQHRELITTIENLGKTIKSANADTLKALKEEIEVKQSQHDLILDQLIQISKKTEELSETEKKSLKTLEEQLKEIELEIVEKERRHEELVTAVDINTGVSRGVVRKLIDSQKLLNKTITDKKVQLVEILAQIREFTEKFDKLTDAQVQTLDVLKTQQKILKDDLESKNKEKAQFLEQINKLASTVKQLSDNEKTQLKSLKEEQQKVSEEIKSLKSILEFLKESTASGGERRSKRLKYEEKSVFLDYFENEYTKDPTLDELFVMYNEAKAKVNGETGNRNFESETFNPKLKEFKITFGGYWMWPAKLVWIVEKIKTILVNNPTVNKIREDIYDTGRKKYDMLQRVLDDEDRRDTSFNSQIYFITKVNENFYLKINDGNLADFKEVFYWIEKEEDYDICFIPKYQTSKEEYKNSSFFYKYLTKNKNIDVNRKFEYSYEENKFSHFMQQLIKNDKIIIPKWDENVKMAIKEYEKLDVYKEEEEEEEEEESERRKRRSLKEFKTLTINPGFYSIKDLFRLVPNLTFDKHKVKFTINNDTETTLIKPSGATSKKSHGQLYELLIDSKDGFPNPIGRYQSIGIHLNELASVCTLIDEMGNESKSEQLYEFRVKPDENGNYFGVNQYEKIRPIQWIPLRTGTHQSISFKFTDHYGKPLTLPSAIKIELEFASDGYFKVLSGYGFK